MFLPQRNELLGEAVFLLLQRDDGRRVFALLVTPGFGEKLQIPLCDPLFDVAAAFAGYLDTQGSL